MRVPQGPIGRTLQCSNSVTYTGVTDDIQVDLFAQTNEAKNERFKIKEDSHLTLKGVIVVERVKGDGLKKNFNALFQMSTFWNNVKVNDIMKKLYK